MSSYTQPDGQIEVADVPQSNLAPNPAPRRAVVESDFDELPQQESLFGAILEWPVHLLLTLGATLLDVLGLIPYFLRCLYDAFSDLVFAARYFGDQVWFTLMRFIIGPLYFAITDPLGFLLHIFDRLLYLVWAVRWLVQTFWNDFWDQIDDVGRLFELLWTGGSGNLQTSPQRTNVGPARQQFTPSLFEATRANSRNRRSHFVMMSESSVEDRPRRRGNLTLPPLPEPTQSQPITTEEPTSPKQKRKGNLQLPPLPPRQQPKPVEEPHASSIDLAKSASEPHSVQSEGGGTDGARTFKPSSDNRRFESKPAGKPSVPELPPLVFQPTRQTKLADENTRMDPDEIADEENLRLAHKSGPFAGFSNFYHRCPACRSEEVYPRRRDGRFCQSKSELSLILQHMFCERCTVTFRRPGRLLLAPQPVLRPADTELYDH